MGSFVIASNRIEQMVKRPFLERQDDWSFCQPAIAENAKLAANLRSSGKHSPFCSGHG